MTFALAGHARPGLANAHDVERVLIAGLRVIHFHGHRTVGRKVDDVVRLHGKDRWVGSELRDDFVHRSPVRRQEGRGAGAGGSEVRDADQPAQPRGV